MIPEQDQHEIHQLWQADQTHKSKGVPGRIFSKELCGLQRKECQRDDQCDELEDEEADREVCLRAIGPVLQHRVDEPQEKGKHANVPLGICERLTLQGHDNSGT